MTHSLASDVLIEIISTHTLTWSVTGTHQKTIITEEISTHTLTWSVTHGQGNMVDG